MKNEENYKVLGWTENISKMHLDGNEEEMDLPENKEVEVAYFPKIRALGIQSHPEWQDINAPEDKKTIDYFRDLLNKTISGQMDYCLEDIALDNLPKKMVK